MPSMVELRVQHLPLMEVWPAGKLMDRGWQEGKFTASEAVTRIDLALELLRFGVQEMTIGADGRTNRYGWPAFDVRGMNPAIAIRFKLKGELVTLCQARFPRQVWNLRSIGLTVKAMRDIDRHGAGQILGDMIRGLALPAPDHWSILGIRRTENPALIQRAYRIAMTIAHPDRGGSDEAAARVNQAYQAALQEISPS